MIKYVADFETTVPDITPIEIDDENEQEDINPVETRVWVWGLCEVGNIENFQWGTTIESFIDWCQKENKEIYFHNLKFDAQFIIYYLLKNGYEYSETPLDKTFNVIVSGMGQFFKLDIIFKKMNKKYKKVTIYDSLKKLPFTVKKIAKDFGLPMQKGEIDYKKDRPIGYIPDDEEIDYLKRDVQIVAIALGIQLENGLTRMTTASDALHTYKQIIGKTKFKVQFPVLPLQVDKDIRDFGYKGGFTYVSKRYAEKDINEGIVFDVNSLYPWVLRHCLLPFGFPLSFDGRYIDDEEYPLYFQTLVCTFKIKEGKIPTIQLKNNFRFVPTDYIENSGLEPTGLVLSKPDLELFFDHYDVDVYEWGGGWKFQACTGMFDEYVDHFMSMKATSGKGTANYFISKLLLNALYGKFGKNPDVTGKYPVLDEETGTLKYKKKEQEMSEPIYLPLAAYVTSWARNKTIRTAQELYPRFIYADTDSIHLEGAEVPNNIKIHNTELGAWKHEGTFSRGRFLRPKTYIEEIEGKLHVTCAGMPENVKEQVTWENFKRGQVYTGKLLPKQVAGGVVLVETEFKIN
jgi:hypothetical protein